MRNEPPWLLLHRASRSPSRFQDGLRSSADYLELDVWLESGRVALRHDPLWIDGFPFVTRHRGFPLPRLRRFWLDQVEVAGRAHLDLKDPCPQVVDRCVETLRATGSLAGATVSTPIWPLLDRLATLAPEVRRFYSIGRGDGGTRRWAEYLARIDAGGAGAGVSIHHTSATPDRLAHLRDRGLNAICYTVNDFDQGLALVDAGARGLTTDSLALIARWRDYWAVRDR